MITEHEAMIREVRSREGRRIFKYHLPLHGECDLMVGGDPVVLSVGWQQVPVVWVMCDPESEAPLHLSILFTGDYEEPGAEFVGTVQSVDHLGAPFVVHIFRR